ncbi:MAG TPA: FAD-binding oxidoreductase, partial [Actinomycetota bacterium]|nr:FAD-binding oxidoreductase [Actinomycetota bacterium]
PHRDQLAHGAEVELLDERALDERFPWLNADGIGAATFGTGGEGWFDPAAALRKVQEEATALGARFVADEVVAIRTSDDRVRSVELRTGGSIECGHVVDAAGPAAAAVAGLAGATIPVEPRKRTVSLFRPGTEIEDFPNLVDPTVEGRGLYVRPYRDGLYMAVIAPRPERDPATFDQEPDTYLWDEIVRAAVGRRVRGFEDAELVGGWAGHYEMNTFDQNAILGPHPAVDGFWLACGFSGHGVMHAPAAGRGIAELITRGAYEALDLSPFSYDRIERGHALDDVQPSEARVQRAGV